MSNFASVEAEQAVLGSLLIDSGCVRSVAAILRETDFSVALNQELFRVICTMDRDGQPIDGLTVCQVAKKERLADEKTLRSYLAQLMEITPTAANAAEYAEIVARTARRRELKTALEDSLTALNEQEPEDTVLTQLDAALAASAQRTESELLAPKEQVDSFLTYRERIDEGTTPYVRTGIKALDKLLGGGMTMMLGDLIEMQFLGAAYNPHLGSAISLVMMIVVLICMAVMNRFGEGEEEAMLL